MTTTSRMLALLSLLQARRDWPGPLLSERLEVSARTVRRDVDRLRGLGYRIAATKGPDGGYRLDAGSELPPLLFDDDQAVAISLALQLAASAGAGIEEAAERALATVRQVMPSRLRNRVDALQVTAIGTGGAPLVDPAVLVAAGAASRAREVLRFDYGTDSSRPPRRVEPHHLVARDGRWYLVAFDLDRGEWRVYRLDRMTPRTPTGPRFAPRDVPGGDVSAFVAARFKGSDTGDRWPCTGEVVLGLRASRVLPFAGDGSVEDLGDGRCRLRLGSWSWPALAAAFLRFDADLEVVGPPELDRAFAALAERSARAAPLSS